MILGYGMGPIGHRNSPPRVLLQELRTRWLTTLPAVMWCYSVALSMGALRLRPGSGMGSIGQRSFRQPVLRQGLIIDWLSTPRGETWCCLDPGMGILFSTTRGLGTELVGRSNRLRTARRYQGFLTV